MCGNARLWVLCVACGDAGLWGLCRRWVAEAAECSVGAEVWGGAALEAGDVMVISFMPHCQGYHISYQI